MKDAVGNQSVQGRKRKAELAEVRTTVDDDVRNSMKEHARTHRYTLAPSYGRRDS